MTPLRSQERVALTDSVSFLPVLEGRQPRDQPVRGPAVMQAGSSPAMMIRSGDWKLINQLGSGGFSKPSSIKPGPGDPAGQLYNLRADLAETNNLYLKHPEIVARLEGEMQRIVKGAVRKLGPIRSPSPVHGRH